MGEGSRRNRKKRPAWQIVSAAVATGLLCFGAAYAIGYGRQASALNAEIAAIRARGEAVRFAELAPPAGDESLVRGDALAAALEKLKPLDHEFIVAFGGETLPEIADFAPFLPTLDESRAQLDEIVRLCREGDCRFRYDFATTVPVGILLPSVQKTDDLRTLLVTDFLRLAAAGASDEAAAKVCDLLLIASVLRHDPFYVSQNVRWRNEETALDLLELLLAANGLSSEKLARLDQRLLAAETTCRLGPTVRGERAALMSTIECLGRPEMGEMMDSLEALTPDGQGRQIVSGAYWKNLWWGSSLYAPWRMKEQTFMLGALGRAAEIIDEPGPKATSELEQASWQFRLASREYPICAIFMPGLTNSRDQSLAHRQRLIAARLAIQAIRRRAHHGNLPETLDELAEGAKVSAIGLRTGEPLNYDISEAGFAIYDRGEDGSRWGGFMVRPRDEEKADGGPETN
jgi:hypothetical protein